MSTPTKSSGAGWVVATLVLSALMLLWLLWPRKGKTSSSSKSSGGASGGGDAAVDKGGIPLPGEGKGVDGIQRQPGTVTPEDPIQVNPVIEEAEPDMPPARGLLDTIVEIFDPNDFGDEFVEII